MEMNRRQFVRNVGFGAAAFGLGPAVKAIGGDEPWDNKLYPTGNADADYRNIQAAVRRGGTVRLMAGRGDFNLFERTVLIERPVRIIGQGTKINFGKVPAFSCTAAVRLSMGNITLVDRSRQGTLALYLARPGQGSSGIDMSAVAIGGDEPWD